MRPVARRVANVRVNAYSISLDGYGAGPEQSLQHPLGKGAEALHRWFTDTPTFRREVLGKTGGREGVDEDFAARSFEKVGAWILGRNMFAPSRGPWPDDGWKGWWGDEPPYHVPTFILTHHAREPIEMAGGTTFYFVTAGIHEALRLAQEAARGKDVRIGGGANTIRQYLQERLIDEMHLAVSPVLLGQGEPLFEGLDLKELGYTTAESVASEHALHVVLRKG